MGLLARATVMREQWGQTVKVESKPLVLPLKTKKLHHTKPVVKRNLKPMKAMRPVTKKTSHPKLRKLATALFLVGLTLNSKTIKNTTSLNASIKQSTMPKIELEVVQPEIEQALTAKIDHLFDQDFTHSVVSEAERDNLARLVYGEAGPDIIDWIEVIHTVLNRYASPLFKGTINDIITAENQYLGFNAKHPVIPEIREVVDFIVNDWEAHGCQEIDDCNHYYFVTDIPGTCNKYKISPKGSHGSWLASLGESYEHYCPTAKRQAKSFKLKQYYKVARKNNQNNRATETIQPTQQLQPTHQLAHIHMNDICMM